MSKKNLQINFTLTLPDGRKKRIRRKSPFTTKKETEKYKQLLIKEELNNYTAGVINRITFNELVDIYINRHLLVETKATTQDRAKSHIKRLRALLGNIPLTSLNKHILENLRGALWKERKPGTKASSLNKILSLLNTMLNKAYEWDYLPYKLSVRKFKEEPPETYYFTAEEVQKIADNIRPDLKVFVLLAFKTGLRVSELLGLQWGDINTSEMTIIINKAFTRFGMSSTKTNKIRYIPISKDTLNMLNEYHTKDTGFIFESPVHPGQPYSYHTIRVHFKNALAKAGLNTKAGLHSLRHSTGTHLIKSNVNLRVVQTFLGHSTPEITLRYTHIVAKNLRGAINQANF